MYVPVVARHGGLFASSLIKCVMSTIKHSALRYTFIEIHHDLNNYSARQLATLVLYFQVLDFHSTQTNAKVVHNVANVKHYDMSTINLNYMHCISKQTFAIARASLSTKYSSGGLVV